MLSDSSGRITTEWPFRSISLYAFTSSSSFRSVSLYPDDDHDGIADNGKVLKIGGKSSYDLSSRSIYGYKDTTPYKGDVTIYMYGGSIGRLYGAKGSSKSESNLHRSMVQSDYLLRVVRYPMRQL